MIKRMKKAENPEWGQDQIKPGESSRQKFKISGTF